MANISVINKDGVVQWSERNTDASGHTTIKIHFATYDPQRGAWIMDEGFFADNRNVISSGVMEWTTFTPDAFNTTYYVTVTYAIYDPVRGRLAPGQRAAVHLVRATDRQRYELHRHVVQHQQLSHTRLRPINRER